MPMAKELGVIDDVALVVMVSPLGCHMPYLFGMWVQHIHQLPPLKCSRGVP